MRSPVPKDPADRHVDAIFTAMQYVAARCPRQYDYEMELRFSDILKSFDDHCRGRSRALGEPSDVLFDDALGRNYFGG
jgi:hypothetical protein